MKTILATICVLLLGLGSGSAWAEGSGMPKSIAPVLAQLLAQATDQSGAQTEAPVSRPGAAPVSPAPHKPGSAVAQSCPPADPGEAFCGFFGGWCRYCDQDYLHYCPSNDTCYRYFSDAQEACGNSYVICGGPAN